jgi:membrane dipeptidase
MHVRTQSSWGSRAGRLSNRARKLASMLLIDGHNDLPWALRDLGDDLDLRAGTVGQTHTDLPRLRAGDVGGQFWSVYVPSSDPTPVSTVLEQIDRARRLIRKYPDTLAFARTADEVRTAAEHGQIASLLGAEGGHCIDSDLAILRCLYELGVRYMTLTHNANVPWADSATDEPVLGGLSDFGREVVHEMQRIGMLVDLSHVSPGTMRDALHTAQAPVIFSHSSAKAICGSPRNVPDDVLERLTANGGVCMVTFVAMFVSQECADWFDGLKKFTASKGLDPRSFHDINSVESEWTAAHPVPRATLSQVADHVEHVRSVAGVEHVGIGGDFDGTTQVTEGLEDVSKYPALFAELRARGWSEADMSALAGANLLRVLRDAESYAARSIV